MELIVILIIVISVFWLFAFIKANDFDVPTKSWDSFKDLKKVLVIFPHADDEGLSMGGYISNLISRGVDVTWVILSHGERGNEDAHYDEDLKLVRDQEAQHAAVVYGIKKLIQKDYPDNDMTKFKAKLTVDIRNILSDIKPDIVITYDLSGLYGHPDHIVTSEVVTSLTKKLWYITCPQKLLNQINLPEHMANDPVFKSRRTLPSFKIYTGLTGIFKKIRGVYSYSSQMPSFSKSVPIRQLPIWFYVSLTLFEYFHDPKSV